MVLADFTTERNHLQLAVVAVDWEGGWVTTVDNRPDVQAESLAVVPGYIAVLTNYAELIVFSEDGTPKALYTVPESCSEVAAMVDDSGQPLFLLPAPEGLLGLRFGTPVPPIQVVRRPRSAGHKGVASEKRAGTAPSIELPVDPETEARWAERDRRQAERKRQLAQPIALAGLEGVFSFPGDFVSVTSGRLGDSGKTRVVAVGWEREPGSEGGNEGELLDKQVVLCDLSGNSVERRPAPGTADRATLAQLDDDAESELLWPDTRGGSLIAQEADGSPMWTYSYGKSGPDGAVGADLDGDGEDEVVASYSSCVRVLDARGELLWTLEDTRCYGPPFVGDLDGDGFPEIVGHGGPRKVSELTTGSPGPPSSLFQSGHLIVWDARAQVNGVVAIPMFLPLVAVAELDADHPGAEIVISGSTMAGDNDLLVALAGDGSEIWRFPLDEGKYGDTRVLSAEGGLVGLGTSMGKVLVVSSDGHLMAKGNGFGRVHALDWATDEAGTPVLLVACERGLYGLKVEGQ
jgi:hypothetical protein